MTETSSDAVLVVSHEASRTGAVLQLLSVLEHWKDADHDFEVLIRRRGPMLSRFEALAPTTCLTPPLTTPVRLRFDRVRRGGVFDRTMLAVRRPARSASYRALFLNTVTNGDIVERLPSAPTTTWVHEQGVFVDTLVRPRSLARLTMHDRRLVAVSESVRDDLARLTPAAAAQIPVVSPSPVARLVDDPSAARRALCRSLGLPEDTLIVGASGRLTRLKSPETFIEVAARVAAAAIAQQMAFVWLGAGDVAACQQHAADRGLANVHFIGAAADPAPFFAAIDLFVVVSVTDAFPLVALEAAQAGAPVVCFGDTGGIGEFVRDDAGVVIPTRDVGRMAEVVVRLAGNPAERGRLGATAARRVATSYRPDVTAGRLWDIVVGEREPRLTGES